MKMKLSDDELVYMLEEQLPAILERHPEMETRVYYAFMKTFATKGEVAAVVTELHEFRTETAVNFQKVDQRFEQVDQHFEQVDQRFEQVDQRFEQVDQRFEQVDQRFEQVDQRFVSVDHRFDRVENRLEDIQQSLNRLGARWGIRNEKLWRATISELLEKSFGVSVSRKQIGGEEFDLVIFDGQHILVEITASSGPKTQKTLERKRQLYEEATGVKPARFILATASIHSRRAQALRDAGFEVIEPEEDESLEDPRYATAS